MDPMFLLIMRFFNAPEPPEIPAWEIGLKITFYIPSIVINIVGNSLVILILAFNKKMRTTTNLLILNLSVSDILVACFCSWIHLVSQVTAGNEWIFGAFMCKFSSFAQVAALTSSVLTLTVISLERFQAIVFPLKRKLSHKITIVVIVCSWIISMGTASPYLFVKEQSERQYADKLQILCKENWPSYYIGLDEYGKCETEQPGMRLYFTLTFIIMYAMPILVMGVTYSIITWTLMTRKGPGGKGTSSIDRARKKIIRMLIAVLVFFVICWTPQWGLLLNDAYFPPKGNQQRDNYVVALKYVALYIAYTNSAINPIMYAGFNENFRRGFLDAFKCRLWNKNNRIGSDVGNSTIPVGSMRNHAGTSRGMPALTKGTKSGEDDSQVYGATND